MNQSKNYEEMLATGETSTVEDLKPEEEKKSEEEPDEEEKPRSYRIASEVLKFSNFTEGSSCDIGCCTRKCENFCSTGSGSHKVIQCALCSVEVVPRVICLPWLRGIQGALQTAKAQIEELDKGNVLRELGVASLKADMEARVKAKGDVYRKDGVEIRGENVKLKKQVKGISDKLEAMDQDVVQSEYTVSFLGNKIMELQEFVREKNKYEKALEKKAEEIDRIKPRLQMVEKENGRLMVEDRAKDARISSLETKIKMLTEILKVKESKEGKEPSDILPGKKEEAQPSV